MCVPACMYACVYDLLTLECLGCNPDDLLMSQSDGAEIGLDVYCNMVPSGTRLPVDAGVKSHLMRPDVLGGMASKTWHGTCQRQEGFFLEKDTNVSGTAGSLALGMRLLR